MAIELLIYDFDGVIADSELLANQALQRVLADHGCEMALSDTVAHFMGKREDAVLAELQRLTGQPQAPLRDQVRAATYAALDGVQEVPGARATIEAFSGTARCIGSSSSFERLAFCLDRLDLTALFAGCVFSAEQVVHGKPAPDIFLHAAGQMGVSPPNALVIEDSVSGVMAARAAGMRTFGLTAAAHQTASAGSRLFAAGAEAVFDSHAELRSALHKLLDPGLAR